MTMTIIVLSCIFLPIHTTRICIHVDDMSACADNSYNYDMNVPFILELFLGMFGAGHFALGNIICGIAQLVLFNVSLYMFCLISFISDRYEYSSSYLLITYYGMLVWFIWWVKDLLEMKSYDYY